MYPWLAGRHWLPSFWMRMKLNALIRRHKMFNRNSPDALIRAADVNLPPMGRSGAFESEAMPHLNDLYRAALHMLQHSAKASDAVQETYLRAWKAFGKYQRCTNCKAWLFQILINVVRHKRGSRFNRTTLSNGSDTPDHVVSA